MTKVPPALAAVLTAAVFLSAAPVHAQGHGTHNSFGDQTGNTGVMLNNSSDDNTIANANGGAGGAGGTGVGGTATGGSVTGGSASGATLNTTGNSVSVEARKREAASAIANPPSVVGTDSCLSPWGAAGQATVFGLSLGGVQEDPTCRRIKLAREYDRMGWAVAAASMHCMNGTEAVVAMRAEGIDCRDLTARRVSEGQYRGVPPLGQDMCWHAQSDALLWGELRRKGMCE